MLYDKSVKENDCWESSRSNTLELRNLLRHCGNQPINASQPPIVGLFIEMWEGRVSKSNPAARPGWVVPLRMINKSINSQEFDKTRLNYPVVASESRRVFGRRRPPPGWREGTTGTGNRSVHLITYLQWSDNKNIKEGKGKKRAKRVHDYIYTRDSLFSLKLHNF